jgi:anti-sigma-K factor RskA
LKNRHWAEEVLQDAFVKVWQHAAEYNPQRGAAMTWMINIVRNQPLALDPPRPHPRAGVHAPMKYSDPALRQILAAKYALASLHGVARLRFERLLRTDAELRRLVQEWQGRSRAAPYETRPTARPSHVLAAIQRRIDEGARSTDAASKGFWNRLGFRRGFSAATAALAAVLAVLTSLLIVQPAVTLAASYVAVLQNQAAQPVLVVTAYRNPFRLKTEPIALPAPAAGQMLQIWAVEKGIRATRPLAW